MFPTAGEGTITFFSDRANKCPDPEPRTKMELLSSSIWDRIRSNTVSLCKPFGSSSFAHCN